MSGQSLCTAKGQSSKYTGGACACVCVCVWGGGGGVAGGCIAREEGRAKRLGRAKEKFPNIVPLG